MSIDRTRHGRQIRLPEIGEAGQERLAAAEVVPGGAGDAREIEAAYLAGAGIRVNADATAAPDAQAEAGVKRAVSAMGIGDVAAREVAEGALRALIAMRRIVGLGGGSG